MTDQEFTRKLGQLRMAAAELLSECKKLQWQKTSDGIMVQVDTQTGEPVADDDGYLIATPQHMNPDTCGDSLRLYVPVEPWEPPEEL